MTGALDRTLLLCVSFALVSVPALATTVPDSRGAWTNAVVPIELRTRVHMSAREVPAFPDEDPKLMDLRNWPKKREVQGRLCELVVSKVYNDARQPPPRPELNQTTSASYTCRYRWWPWGRPQMRGPHYTWTSAGQLLERGYIRGRLDYVVYQVDRAGRLVAYEDTKHGSTEYFDPDGVLIAGEYAPVNLDWRSEGYRGGTVSVWLGERVSHDEFVRKLRKRNQETAWRY